MAGEVDAGRPGAGAAVRRGSAADGKGGQAAHRALGGATAAALAGLLFLGYLRVSWTVAATPDGAAQAIQARAMLGGNWLLHGWTLSDVSFYSTELPEYVLVEMARPFGTGVIHIAAAATYTLLVLAAFALARGRARGREGLVRGVVAAGVMLAPQLGYGAFVLLLSPDHTGTQLPLLLGWLLLDLAPRRWWVPAALGLLLAWVQFADRVALLTAVLPLIAVCAVRAAGDLRRRWPRKPLGARALREAHGSREAHRSRETPGSWEFEAALAGAAAVSIVIAWGAARVLAAAGGFAAHPFPLTLTPARLLWTHAWLTGWGILELSGANFLGVSGWTGITLAVAHLAGLAACGAAFAVALGRFLRPGGGGNLIDSVLAVAIVVNLGSYVLSTAPGTVLGTGYDAREIAAVLPLGAVLAGRVLGPWLAGRVPGAGLRRVPGAGLPRVPGGAALAGSGRAPRGRHRAAGAGLQAAKARDRSGSSAVVLSALSLVLAAYAVAFGYSAAQPSVPGQDSVLARWLVAHRMRYGLGGTEANITTLDSGGRVRVAPAAVRSGRVRPLLYQSAIAAYNPRLHDATFMVTRAPAPGAGYAVEDMPLAVVRATFGAPDRVYRFSGYTVDVWSVNLLTKLHT